MNDVVAKLARCALIVLPTIALYAYARRVHGRRPSAWTLPIVITTVVSGALLLALHVDLEIYAQGSRPLLWLLGPATVALSVPLWRERALLRRRAWPICLGVMAGASIAMISALLLARAFGLSSMLMRSLVTKSVTTPVAMPIARNLGGDPDVATAIVIVTGLFGMVFGPALLTRARIDGAVARGLSLGTAAHGIGTAAALSESTTAGAASALAMVLAALFTSVVAPVVGKVLAMAGIR
jgi:predicted murein hydrolase (TIGR00659 family)